MPKKRRNQQLGGIFFGGDGLRPGFVRGEAVARSVGGDGGETGGEIRRAGRVVTSTLRPLRLQRTILSIATVRLPRHEPMRSGARRGDGHIHRQRSKVVVKGRKVRLGERLLGAGGGAALALGVVLCLLVRGLAGVSLGPARTHGAGKVRTRFGRGNGQSAWVRSGRKTMAEVGGKRRATHLLSCLIFFFSASVSLSFLTGAVLMGMVVGYGGLVGC